jgi:hypothetical protein
LHIPETESKPNEYCKHCEINKGCNIYEERPDGCREFQCMWLQMEKVHIDLRPDKCGVIFEKFTDNVIMGVTDGYVSYRAMGQIESFKKENISVVMMNHNTKTKKNFLSKGHTKEFVEKEINDSAKLY